MALFFPCKVWVLLRPKKALDKTEAVFFLSDWLESGSMALEIFWKEFLGASFENAELLTSMRGHGRHSGSGGLTI